MWFLLAKHRVICFLFAFARHKLILLGVYFWAPLAETAYSHRISFRYGDGVAFPVPTYEAEAHSLLNERGTRIETSDSENDDVEMQSNGNATARLLWAAFMPIAQLQVVFPHSHFILLLNQHSLLYLYFVLLPSFFQTQ